MARDARRGLLRLMLRLPNDARTCPNQSRSEKREAGASLGSGATPFSLSKDAEDAAPMAASRPRRRGPLARWRRRRTARVLYHFNGRVGQYGHADACRRQQGGEGRCARNARCEG